ncbi:eukaryotic translation initiation factor 2D-like, partial [Anopheles bellator]|uniref:eukaryotic translation initiation factor 2D-like n=1 Tax=Anopheles bellator TaxID=139047 RepID=UPI002647DCD5
VDIKPNGEENGSDSDSNSEHREANGAVEEEEKPPSPDDLIRGALLNVMELHGKKITLPLLTSTFYPKYLQPEIPEGVEMKKSTFKKVGTFFKRMAEEGLLKIEEEKKGIEKVTVLNLDHPAVRSFYPYKAVAKVSEKELGGPGTRGLFSYPLLLTEMYAVNDRTSKLFGCFNVSNWQALEPKQVRNYIRDYVGRNKLINPNTKVVTLDETLTEVCGTGAGGGMVALSELIKTVLNSMTSTFEINSQKGPVMKSGKRAVVHLTTAKPKVNKTVTLISNLDDYGINVGEFAKAVKLGAATSTTMAKVRGTKGEQLQVQGNHVKFVYELLTKTYQVPKTCITGLELAKKQKKRTNRKKRKKNEKNGRSERKDQKKVIANRWFDQWQRAICCSNVKVQVVPFSQLPTMCPAKVAKVVKGAKAKVPKVAAAIAYKLDIGWENLVKNSAKRIRRHTGLAKRSQPRSL